MANRMTTALAATALLLAGCDQDSHVASSSDAAMVEMIVPPPGAPAMAGGSAAQTPPPRAVVPTAPQIAYTYSYGLETPGRTAPELMRRHEAACKAAGPTKCQVVSSSSDRMAGSDYVMARLEMRAAPVWLDAFRNRLAGDAESVGGRVASASTGSEDLTRSLSDTGARLRALTTLRDRLQSLLATRSAPLDQLLATERELARVQGELDATQSALLTMQTRVAMSAITLDYQPTPTFASEGAFAPVSNALRGSLGVFMGSLGAVIYALSAILPVALIVVPLVWWWLKRRKRRPAKVVKTPPAPAEAPIETL